MAKVAKRRFDLKGALAVSAAVHALVLLLTTMLVTSAVQACKTDHPRASVKTPVLEPPEPAYPPVQCTAWSSDAGPYVDDPRFAVWFYGRSELHEEEGYDEPTSEAAKLFREELLRPEAEQSAEPDEVPEDLPEEFEMSGPGQADAISDIPLFGTGVVGNKGVGGGASGVYGKPGELTGGPSRAGRREVVNAGSGDHLAAAIRWLAENQQADGSWLVTRRRALPVTEETQVTVEKDEFRAALTGLATLAMLGKGHTETTGRYSAHVRKALAFLMDEQDSEGQIGINSSAETGGGYNHAISGLALAEACRLGGSRRIREAAQRAVDWSCRRHQADQSGWGHSPGSAECDTSVTAWFVLQLTTALGARLRVPGSSFQGALNWLASVERCEKDSYLEGVIHRGTFGPTPDEQPTRASSAAGVRAKVALGWSPYELDLGVSLVMRNPPEWETKDFVYWYLAFPTVLRWSGRGRHGWKRALTDALRTHQRRGGPDDGSWDPGGDVWGDRAGRVFTTALGALCLEVGRRQAVSERYARRTEHVLEWRLRRMYLRAAQSGGVGGGTE